MLQDDPALSHCPIAPYDTIEKLREENKRLREALTKIAEWNYHGTSTIWAIETARKALKGTSR